MTTTEHDTTGLADFELVLENPKQGLSDAVIFVRWCLSKETGDRLKRMNAVKPYMILLVAADYGSSEYPDWRVTQTKPVPLRSEMTSVRFNRAGTNRVFGVIAWQTNGDKRKLLDAAHDKSAMYGYDGEVRTSYMRDYTATYETNRLDFVATAEVDVPAELFAPEPAKWRKSLVGKFFSDRGVDECNFRRRFMISAAWLPFYLVAGFLLRLLRAAIFGFVGYRDINWKAVYRPIRYNVSDVTSEISIKRSPKWWTRDKHGQDRPGWWLFLQPVSYVVLTVIIYVIGSLQVLRNGQPVDLWGLSWLDALVASVLVHIGLVTFVAVLVALSFVLDAIRPRRDDDARLAAERQAAAAKSEKKRLASVQLERELSSLVCNAGQPKVATLDALPKNKQTLRLRYDGIKRRVCRPYSR